jgi:mannose-6-phosphate isomerase-like protein (cupin superfamily)
VVMCVFAGSGVVETDGRPQAVAVNSILTIPKGSRRKIAAGSTGIVYLNVHRRRRRLMPQASRPAR